jgi:hypothetical protein
VSRSIKLITGIPRSGTTLCCKLLNQRGDVMALHEPINPGTLAPSATEAEAVDAIVQQIAQFDLAIEQGLPFTHGDKGGLNIDNPVGQTLKDGVRKVVAKRGEVQLPACKKDSYTLIIKQNALFTALMPELTKQFPMICIVRNPVDVLLSWLTVDLPVNRGHIPAGERFDAKLKVALSEPDCLTRQLIIYQWFMQAFLNSGLPIVRYDDIISSDGAILDKTFGWKATERAVLAVQERKFDKDTLMTLEKAKTRLLALNCGDLYTKKEIEVAMQIHGI